MIFKKPYGFLIKHFRIIHIIITLLTIYIAFNTRNILSFFRRFISNGYSITVVDNMAAQYINWTLYIAIFLALASLIIVFILLRMKKKPNKMYLATIIYYVILFIAIIIAAYLINGLSDGLWSASSARTYRDIAQLIYYPQFFFIIVMALRSLGFNVKQFDFQNDLKELEITEADSEEVELNINFETYKAERFIRRFIREFYYYYLENKIIVNIIFGVVVIITVFLAVKSYEKIKYTYDEGENFYYNGFSINVKDSILTNVDENGDVIVDGKYYLILKLEITNNGINNAYLNYDNLKIYFGNDYINPSLDIGNHFIDYGDPFMNDRFDPGETYTYIIPYILNENQVSNNYRLTIYTGPAQKSRSFLAVTINVNLKPSKFMDQEVVREAKVNENVSFSSTFLNQTSINIPTAEISARYEYQYESCYRDNCRNYTGLVLAGSGTQSNRTLVILDYDFVMDTTTDAYSNIKTISDFANAFMTVEYVKLNNTYEQSFRNVTPSRVKDKLILETTNEIETAQEVNLLITIRNRCYKIRIK